MPATTATTPRPRRLIPPLLKQPLSPTTATTPRPSALTWSHRLMPPLLSPTTTTTTSRPSAVRWSHRLMSPLLEQPSSPTTATTPCHLVVMMLALLGLEGSQTRQLPTRPSLLTTATTPSLPVVIQPYADITGLSYSENPDRRGTSDIHGFSSGYVLCYHFIPARATIITGNVLP